MTLTAVDFAARLISPQSIKDAGHSAVLAYVSRSRPGSSFGAKPITRQYADECKRVGLDIASIFQYGKPGGTAPSDWTTGYDGGHRMALEARDTHFAIGGPGWCPIFFAVDEDISVDQWNATALQFFKGACDAIGREWVGVYGSSKVCAWAIEDNVIGGVPGARWAWQTRSWSNGEREVEAVLYQRVIDTPSSPGPKIDGSAVDVSDILKPDYGQWSIYRGPIDAPTTPPEAPVTNKPAYTEIERMGDSSSPRGGKRITNFLLHTEEGNSSAESLAGYLNNPNNNASYHYTLRDGILCDVVDTDLASWSVGDANSFTINLCFAGSRASWSRDQWLTIEHDVAVAAWIAVQDAKKYAFSTEVIAPPYHRADGISDHYYVTKIIGWGTHTDVGPNFPWDVFARYVRAFADGAPAPTVNAINDAAAAAPWLGARVTQGENTCPDGKGRFAEFEHGHVYWTPETGAHAVPRGGLFEAYSEYEWERGPLGYPTVDFAKVQGGACQAFQGGILYRKDGRAHGYYVRGKIWDRFTADGFEGGKWGWPASNEVTISDGVYQEFDNGRLYWTPNGTLGIAK